MGHTNVEEEDCTTRGAGEDRPRDTRRALLGYLGLLGATTLAGCASAVERGASDGEPANRIASGLSGAAATESIGCVESVLGEVSAAGSRAGALARSDAATLGVNVVIAAGCRVPNDGGGGIFVWNAAGGVDDGGTIIVPGARVGTSGPCWQRLFSGPLDVRWFGAVADGVTDDHPAIRNAIAVAAAAGGVVWLPAAAHAYVCDHALVLPSAVTLRGSIGQKVDRTRGGTILLFRGAGSGFVIGGISETALEDMQLQTDASAGPVIKVIRAGSSGLLRFTRLRIVHENALVAPVSFGAPGAGVQVDPCVIESCTVSAAAGMATPLIEMFGEGGGLNNIAIRDCVLEGAPLTDPAKRALVHIEETDSGLVSNIEIRNCIFEIPHAGAIQLRSVSRSRIVNCWAGDLEGHAPTAPLIQIRKAAAPGALACKQIIIDGLQTDIGQRDAATIAFDGLTSQGIVVVGSVVPWVDNGGGAGLVPICNVGSQIHGYSGDPPVGLGDSGTLVTASAYTTAAQSLTVHNGLNSNATAPFLPFGYVRVAGNITSAFAIGGFVSPAAGQTLRVYNPTRFPMTIVDEDAQSLPEHRIRTLRAGDVVLPDGPSFATFLYDGVDRRWILESTNEK